MKRFLQGFLAAGAFTAVASAETIATFADPAVSGATPLFQFVSGAPGIGILSGGWNANGLLLQTPGLAAPDFANAHFNMPPVAAGGGPVVWSLAPGSIDFFDSGNNPLFTISFQAGTLTSPTGVGGSDFAGNGVTFSGNIIPPDLIDEAFAFSFANPQGNLAGYTVTSAFTSSASRIPEPGSLALLVLGGVATLLRRK